MLARALKRIMRWAIAKNGGDQIGYLGEDDPRWAYVIKAPDGSPYLSRLLLPRVRLPIIGEVRPMIHQFHRPDLDQEPHSHPWERAFSLILSGAYEEERVVGDPRSDRYMNEIGQCRFCSQWRGECPGHPYDIDTKVVRFFNTLSGDEYHRVVRLQGDVFTLFVAGEKKPGDEWGFLTAEGDHITSEVYFALMKGNQQP